MDIIPQQLPYREFYRILLSAVAPRPIAWVSTISADGRPNLAPFSFFNVVSAQPPLLGFSPALRRLEHAMNLTSGEYEPAVNEFELAKLTTRPSQIVRPPQVAESPVSFECKLYQIMDFGTEAPSGSFVIGEVVAVHVSDDVLKEGRLDPGALDLVGRMSGAQYCRTTERFELDRPRVAGKT
jgi:flavin reductase (DIM6/NTAB) family NADH-FMN oxidoreductase RutF